MSNPRLLLVSGAPGAGTSTVSRALVQAARSRDEAAVRIDRSSTAPSVELTGMFGAWDPLLGEVMRGLPALRTVHGLLAAVHAVDDAPDATVVWDAGPIDPLLADLAALDALVLAADRVSGSLVAMAASLAGERLMAARRVQAEVTRALRLLRDGTAGLVLVDEPTPGLRRRVRRLHAQAELLGVPIDLLAINRVPRRRDDWPAQWSEDRRRRAAAAADARIASHCIRWYPDDADAVGLTRRIAKRLPRPLRTSGADSLSPEMITVEQVGDGYALRIPMPHADPSSVRAGRMGEVLVLEVAGLRRMLPLPPVLTRCIVEGGGIVGEDLVLRFIPDPAQWRSAS